MHESIKNGSFPEKWDQVDPTEYLKDIARALLPEGLKLIIKDRLRKIAGKPEVIPGHVVTKTLAGVEANYLITNRSDVNRIVDNFEADYGEALIQTISDTDNPVFFDIGAAQGIYSMPAGNAGAEVHAFDPDPVSAASFADNLQFNPVASSQVTFHQIGLGNQEGILELHTDPEGIYAPSHVKTVKGLTTQICVPVRSVDQLIAGGELPIPNILKIDVEGAESEVLAGMTELLQSEAAPTHIFIEIHSGYLPKFGSSAKAVISDLESAGYKLVPDHFWKRRKELLCHFVKSNDSKD